MTVIATAGGAGPAMDVVPVCGCFFGELLVASLAVVGVFHRSYWLSGSALLLAVYLAAIAIDAVVKFVPSDDPDELLGEAIVWR